ncbi:MAG: M24 family metallopeptidase [Streptosporangiales bacterium]|nr:M24 family metallopeptidase [Streptosporangiales bacterium]
MTVHSSPRFPGLSPAERERRHTLVRDLLGRLDLDGLLVFGDDRNPIDNWLTNDRTGSVVVFPRDGEMTCLVWSTQVIAAHILATERGEDSWVTDMRRGMGGAAIVEVLKEKHLAKGRLGVLGVGAANNKEADGRVPYKRWHGIVTALPDVEFHSMEEDLYPLLAMKSDEELALVRRSAEVGEIASQAMMDVTRPGVGEHEIYAAANAAILREGGYLAMRTTILQCGSRNPAWGPPNYLYRSQEPYVVQVGDVVMAELFPVIGMIETQQQMSIAVGELSPEHKRLEELCLASSAAGLDVLRTAGATFGQLVDAMERPIRETEGAWSITPMIHTVNPLYYTGNAAIGIEDHLPGIDRYRNVTGVRMSDAHAGLTIRPGMCFAFEPNALFGSARINIGGTVVATDGEPLVLNRLANQVNVVPA